MFGEQSAELSLNAPCKSVAAVSGDRLEARFLVGGCSIQDDSLNQINVLRYHSDVNVVAVDASLYHPNGPIQKLITSPQDRTLVLTLGESSEQVTLFRLPPHIMEMTNELILDSDTTTTDTYGGGGGYGHHHDDFDSMTDHSHSTSTAASGLQQSGDLEQKLILESSGSGSGGAPAKMLDMTWRGASDDFAVDGASAAATPGDVLTLDDQGTVTQWDVSMGLAESMRSLKVSNADGAAATPPPSLTMVRPKVIWDPHQPTTVAVSWGRSVRFLDTRAEALGEATPISRAHRYGVTDLDYNPNKPYTLATSGLDGIIHYWDTRFVRRPILTSRGGHSHYAWNVLYNPFHDQLVLSTGTDAVVNLWRVSTISSAPLLTLEDAAPHRRGSGGGGLGGVGVGGAGSGGAGDVASETSAPNVRVARQELSDSVYSAAWSAADAWQYMTVTYDGRVALHHVPSKEKYKILL